MYHTAPLRDGVSTNPTLRPSPCTVEPFPPLRFFFAFWHCEMVKLLVVHPWVLLEGWLLWQKSVEAHVMWFSQTKHTIYGCNASNNVSKCHYFIHNLWLNSLLPSIFVAGFLSSSNSKKHIRFIFIYFNQESFYISFFLTF